MDGVTDTTLNTEPSEANEEPAGEPEREESPAELAARPERLAGRAKSGWARWGERPPHVSDDILPKQ